MSKQKKSRKPKIAAIASSKPGKQTAAAAPPAAKSATREGVSARAHQIWVEAGKPEGKSLEHWVQAERELGLQS